MHSSFRPPAATSPSPMDQALTSANIGIWEWDVITNEVRWNDAVYRIHGVDRETFTVSFESFARLIHPDDTERVQNAIRDALEKDAPFDLEFRIRRPDGRETWVFTNASVIREGGRPVRMIGATLDVTARRHADDTSRWLAAIVDSSDDAIVSKDLNSIITSWNAGAERLFGYKAAEVVGRPVTLLMPDARKNEEISLLERIRRGERIEHFETVRQRRDGTLFDVSLTLSPVKDASGRIVGASKIARDISDRKRVEAALRTSEERFRLLASHAPVGIFLSGQDGGCIFVNARWCEMAGLTVTGAMGTGWTQSVHPDDRERVLHEWQRAVAHGAPSTSEFRFRRPDGSIVWVQGSAVRFDDGDRFQGYLGSCVDVTQRKQAELQADFLHDLGNRISALSQPELILETSQAALGEFLQADRCYFFEVDAAQAIARIGDDWHRPDLPSVHGEHRLVDFGTPEFATLLARARCHISDLREHPATRGRWSSFDAIRMRSLATSAFWQDGRWHLSLAVASRNPREWTTSELELIENVVARVGPIVERARATQALRESERLYRAIGESINYGIWVRDAEGSTTYMSESFLRLVGLTQDQCAGQGWMRALHPDEVEATAAAWKQCAAAGTFWEREHHFKGADGEWHPILSRGVPLRDSAGRIQRWVGINLDISAMKAVQKAARRGELQLQLVTDHAPIFLVQCDRDHRYKFVNAPYAERHGLTREQVIGRHVAELTGAEAYATFKRHMDAALAGRRIEFEQEIPYERLGRRWMHVIYEPERTAEGEVVGLVAVISDVTIRKQAELELGRMRDEALAASRAKDDFLASLSHELRTPLNPVLLLASDAANNPALPPEVRDTFETIRRNISLEARLIDDLLDLTRIARDKLELEKSRVDVHVAVQDAVGNIRSEIEAKHLNLQLFLGARNSWVYGDAVRLQQVCWNVLQNAVKFTREGGQITVVSRVVAETNRLHLEITDNGLGMSPAELASVFSAFRQGEHAATGPHRFGGLGLGLAISRKLVELHGGEIKAASPGRNRGSVFIVELPLAATAPTHPTPSAPAPAATPLPASAPRRILLVEDHVSTRETLQKLLGRRNFDVTAAGSVAEALGHASSRTFDFLVSDVGLPDGDGYQLMAEIRKIQPTLQGIALSGYGMEDDLQRSHAGGFANHLVKPVSIAALEQALAGLTSPSPTR